MSNVSAFPGQQTKAQWIMGLIPCLNQMYMEIVWPVVRPGLDELVAESQGEWDSFRAWKEVFGGSMHLYMTYANRSGQPITPATYQEEFVKKMRDPMKDFAGFVIVKFLETSAHIFAIYTMPEFREKGLASEMLEYVDEKVKAIKAPYISVCVGRDLHETMTKRGYVETTTNYRKKL